MRSRGHKTKKLLTFSVKMSNEMIKLSLIGHDEKLQ